MTDQKLSKDKKDKEDLSQVLQSIQASSNLSSAELNFTDSNLSGGDYHKKDLTQLELKGAKFCKANLQGAILNKVNLTGASFEGADLTGAKLNEVILDGANLQQAVLLNAELKEASLKNADLKEANLKNAKFIKAKLEGAVFHRCRIDCDSDFSGAKFGLFRPLPPKPSRPTVPWRTRAVVRQTLLECCTRISEDDDEVTSEDEEDEDLIDVEVGDDGSDVLLATEKNIIEQCLTSTFAFVKPLIATVHLLLETTNNALVESLRILLTTKNVLGDKVKMEEMIKKSMPKIMAILLKTLLLEPLRKKIVDISTSGGDLLTQCHKEFIRRLYKEILKVQEPAADATPTPSDVDNEYIVIIESAKDDIITELEIFLNNEVVPLLKKLLSDTKKKSDKILTDEVFTKMRAVINDKDIDVVVQSLEPLTQNLGKLLSTGLEGVIRKKCNRYIFQLVVQAEKPIKMAEICEEWFAKEIHKETSSQKLQQNLKKYLPKMGSLKRRFITHVLKRGTKYSVKTGDDTVNIETFVAAMKFSRVELNIDEAELNYLLEMIIKLGDMEITIDKWRDAARTWISVLNLRPQLKAEQSMTVVNCIASDDELIKALSSAHALLYSQGSIESLVTDLSNEPGRHIRDHGYRYQSSIRQEIARIKKVRETQIFIISTIGTFVASALIAVFNYFFQGSNWVVPTIVIFALVVVLVFLYLLKKNFMKAANRRHDVRRKDD